VSAAPSTAAAFPERVGKYELLLPLGTGGTATVYLARTRGVAGFEREVALKLVHAHLRADEESRMHLLEEARLAARIRHPNVVPVTEVDSDAIGVFLVMDYVEGEALSGLVRVLRDQNHRLPPRLIARIMNDSLAGLHAAHELRDGHGHLVGLVHRDFSPQNILVGIEGVARLADFGVAKAASRTVRTKTGLVKGKVAYMSPEQARGHKVDRRCDVWAAGVVVWELVTGRKLYDHEDDVATLLSVVTEEPPRLASVMQGVPPALDEAVAYALTSDVTNRCPSAETLRCMLESAWDECGGMASTAELGAFVRQTVGHKLAERRNLASRGRPSQAPAAGAESNAGDANLAAQRSPSTARAPEDGTKTAISAAVPAAERAEPAHTAPVWRRSVSIALALAVSVVAAGVMGLAVNNPDKQGPTASQPAPLPGPLLPPASPGAAPAPPQGVPTPRLARDDGQDGLPPTPESGGAVREGVTSSDVSGDEDSSSRRNGGEASGVSGSASVSGSRERSRRSQNARSRQGSHRTKAKASARSSAAHAANKGTLFPPRVLPIPQPSERQQRVREQANGEPPPLNLAPDPYDSNR
jgi:serine/threonine protein kinase